jgi:hydrogenase maturation protease
MARPGGSGNAPSAQEGSGPVLVVGYGNPLRGDDGVGPEVVERLWTDDDGTLGPRRAAFAWSHQLTPEMAVDVSQACYVVFVDAASDGLAPGCISVRPLEPAGARAGSGGGAGAAAGGGSLVPEENSPSAPVIETAAVGCWQDLSPAALLALARDLYGAAPPAAIVTISVGSLQFGSHLSPAVLDAVPKAVSSVRDLVAVHAGA